MTAPQQKKLRITGPVSVTANRLSDGAVVWRTRDAGWSPELSQAVVATTAEEAIELLEGAQKRDIEAVGAYIAPVERGEDGTIRPGNLREQIRVFGPTFELPAH